MGHFGWEQRYPHPNNSWEFLICNSLDRGKWLSLAGHLLFPLHLLGIQWSTRFQDQNALPLGRRWPLLYGPSDPSDMSFCFCSDKLWECRESSMMSPFLSLPPKPQGRIFRFFRSVSDTNRCPQDLGASEQALRGPTEAPSLGCSEGESTTHHSHMCWCGMGLGDCWCYSSQHSDGLPPKYSFNSQLPRFLQPLFMD